MFVDDTSRRTLYHPKSSNVWLSERFPNCTSSVPDIEEDREQQGGLYGTNRNLHQTHNSDTSHCSKQQQEPQQQVSPCVRMHLPFGHVALQQDYSDEDDSKANNSHDGQEEEWEEEWWEEEVGDQEESQVGWGHTESRCKG